MSCTLCEEPIVKSGSVRPNIATFSCGHEFHLSCTLSYSAENLSKACPTCQLISENKINLGEDRSLAIQSLIDARRQHVDHSKKGFMSWFTEKSLQNMIKNGNSLDTLKLKGIRPEDIIEERIDWNTISSIYKTEALLDFGFKWHHMITMGFQPHHFKLLDWHQMTENLKLTASDMLKTSITIRELAELNIDIAHLHELGFRLKELKQIGANAETLKLLTDDLDDIKTYFRPTNSEWNEMGLLEWAPEKKPMRVIHEIKTKNGFVF